MRKIFAFLMIAFLAVTAVVPVAFAEVAPMPTDSCTLRHDFTTDPNWALQGVKCEDKGDVCNFDTATMTCGSCCLLDAIYNVTDWIFIFIVVIVVIFVVIGAFNIITAGGSPEKVTAGRNFIVYAVIGLIIALLAKAIPSIARTVIGL
jgi:hypothetical protein